MKGAIGQNTEQLGGSPGEPPPPAAQKPPKAEQGAEGAQASPEEQKAYEGAVLAGFDVIFDPTTSPDILKMMQATPDDPAQGIAQATALVIQILEEQSKGQIPDDMILDIVDEIGGNVMALGAKNGLFTVDENLKGKAAQQIDLLLAEMYGTTAEDAEAMLAEVPEEELAQIQQQQSAIAGGKV